MLQVNHFEKLGKRVLLVLHKRWLNPNSNLRGALRGKAKSDSDADAPVETEAERKARISSIVASWRQRGVLYEMPKGVAWFAVCYCHLQR